MPAITLSNIPSNINTYERLLVWCCQALQNSSNGGTVNAVAGQEQQPEAYCGIFRAADGTDRFACTAYIPLEQATLNDPAEKTWMAANDISSAAPHTNFLSN